MRLALVSTPRRGNTRLRRLFADTYKLEEALEKEGGHPWVALPGAADSACVGVTPSASLAQAAALLVKATRTDYPT